jgi:hypothetical protein
VVVAPPGERAAFEQALVPTRASFRTVDGAEARHAVGCARARGTGGEALYLQLAARKPPREQFAEPRGPAPLLRLAAAARAGRRRRVGFAACALLAG